MGLAYWKNRRISPRVRHVIATVLVILSVQISVTATVSSETSPFAKCWSYPAASDLSISVTADANHVYFIDLERRLHAVDVKHGTKIWSSELGGEIGSDLLILEDSIFVVTRAGESVQSNAAVRLNSISRQTGVTNWTAPLSTSASVSIGMFNGSLFALSDDGQFAVFQNAHSTVSAQKNMGAGLSTRPVFSNGSAWFGTNAKEILRLGPDRTFSPVAKLDNVPTALGVSMKGELLVGDERGNLQMLSSSGASEWKFKNGARISHIVSHDSEFIVASHDNFIYKLSRGGDVDWKRRLPGRLFHRLVVAGDVVVGSVIGDGGVYVIDARTGKILNRIDIGEGNSAGVAGVSEHGSFVLAGPDAVSLYSASPCVAK